MIPPITSASAITSAAAARTCSTPAPSTTPIDIEGWPFRGTEEKEDYLLAFGRLCADKGFHTAIEVAKRTGQKLVIAGAVQHQNRDYYETVIKPQVDGEQIKFRR